MKFLKLFPILFLINIAFAQQTIKDLTVNDFKVENVKQGSKPCPLMTETQRNAIPSPQNGRCIYNTTAGKLNIYNSTSGIWKAAGGGVDAWVPGFNYAVDDLVIQTNKLYQALIAHTSSVFATDLAASRWTEISSGVNTTGSVLDNRITRFDGTTGELIQSSGLILDDSNNLSGANNISLIGDLTLKTSFTGPLKATSGVVSASAINLATEVTGTLPTSSVANLSGVNTGDLLSQTENGSTVTTNNIELPYDQIVTVAAGKRRVETGNENVLGNSSFEHSTAGFGWQATNVTVAPSTTNIQSGKKSVQLTSTTSNWSFDYQSSLYSSAKINQSAEGSLWVQATGVGANDIWLCEGSYTGTPAIGVCDKYDGSGLPRKLKIYVPFKSTGSGIRLMGNTSGTVIYADKAKFDNRDFAYSNINYQESKSFSYPCSGNVNVTCSGSYSLVGNKLFLNGRFQWTGAGNTNAIIFTLPDGLVFSSPSQTQFPNGYSLDVGTAEFAVSSGWYTSNQIYLRRFYSTPSGTNPISIDNSWMFSPVSGDYGTFTIIADIAGKEIGNAAVASESVQVSSDTMPLAFKATAIVDSDPIGTYNTFNYTATSNTYAINASAPTQTSSDMNTNGIRLFTRVYTSASTSASPARISIYVGKGLKSINTNVFKSTGKSNPGYNNFVINPGNQQVGYNKSYNELTGILTIDTGYNIASTVTLSSIVFTDSSIQDNGYFTFSASKYADIASIPTVGNVKVPGANQVDNIRFRFGGTTLSNECTTGTCYKESLSPTSPTTISFVSTGLYNILFPRTYSRLICFSTGYSPTVNVITSGFLSCNNCNSANIAISTGATPPVSTNVQGMVDCLGTY